MFAASLSCDLGTQHTRLRVNSYDSSLLVLPPLGSIDHGRDKTVKFWDTRTATPAAVVNLCERAYSMDTKGAMMVVATADRKVGMLCSFSALSSGWVWTSLGLP